MQISLSLLEKYVDIKDLSTSQIANILTLAGLEVDSIENETPSFSNVICVKILESSPHPKSKKLFIAKVSDGKSTYQVVCGAPNCKKNLKTAFAKEGATLSNGKIHIKNTSIKDVESFGMLLSKKELTIGHEEDKILELPEETPLGSDLTSLSSAILEISLTPNLGHCMSYIGIAREIKALKNKTITYPEFYIKKHKISPIPIQVKTNLCTRYTSCLIENVKIEPSPLWLQNSLEQSGIRSINNIVDILNFVMIEYGQPMHGFDKDKIDQIEVDVLKEDQNVLTLDDVIKTVKKDSLVIKDKKNILAIAGIIGAKESSISQNTKNILLESASFDPISIRKTSKNLTIRTQSSMRFEKGIDPQKTKEALNRACFLIKKLLPNCKIGEDIDIQTKKISEKKINCRISRTNKILGTKLSFSEIENIFLRLDFITKKITEDILQVTVPTFRSDIQKEIDLIEEIARIYGYHNIEKKSPYFTTSNISQDPMYLFEKKLKNILLSLNMQEIITADLISLKLFQTIENKPFSSNAKVEVLHAKSQEHSILRPSFLPSFLEVVKHNTYRKNFNLSMFETGNIHLKKNDQYFEYPTLAFMLSGKRSPYTINKPKDNDFFDLKGILEDLFFLLKEENYSFKKSSLTSFHPGRQASIFIQDTEIGILGQVHPSLLKEFDIKQKVFFSEINLSSLLKTKKIQYKKISPFPHTSRDLTICVKKDISYKSILEKIQKNQSPLLETVSLIDIYPLKDMQKLTLRFIYRDPIKTILFEEAEREHQKIMKLFQV